MGDWNGLNSWRKWRLTPLRARNIILCALIVSGVILRIWKIDNVRISGDEGHYFGDTISFWIRDPSTWRYHPTEGPHAASPGPQGHPVFAQLLVRIAYRLIGASQVTMRVAFALAGIATIVLVLIGGNTLGGRETGQTAAAIMALLPLAVRFNRTLYLDSIFTLLGALLLLVIWKALDNKKWGWWLVCGAVVGLLMGTKTSGFFFLPLLGATALMGSLPGRERMRNILSAFAVAIVVWIVLVDPDSYVRSIIYPVDTGYQSRSIWWFIRYAFMRRAYLFNVITWLITWPVFIIAALGLVDILKRWREKQREGILVLYLLFTSPIVLIHLPGLSGEHGY